MRIWKFLAALVIVIAAIYFIPRIGKSTDIEQSGKELSITVGKHRMTVVIIGHQITNSFLVFSKGTCTGDLFFTTWLSVIPIDSATQLGQRYGDFRESIKCGSQKAFDVQRSMKSMILYAADHDVERKLRSIDKLASAKKDPVIKMTFAELNITNHTVRGEEIPIVFNSNVRPFLVKDVEIIEEDRNF
jgi:hypothetical protein